MIPLSASHTGRCLGIRVGGLLNSYNILYSGERGAIYAGRGISRDTKSVCLTEEDIIIISQPYELVGFRKTLKAHLKSYPIGLNYGHFICSFSIK